MGKLRPLSDKICVKSLYSSLRGIYPDHPSASIVAFLLIYSSNNGCSDFALKSSITLA